MRQCTDIHRVRRLNKRPTPSPHPGGRRSRGAAFQASGTPGHQIHQDRPCGGYVEIDGDRHPIRARITSISGYSAHAGQDDLVNFVRRMRKLPGEVRLVHGDDEAKQTLREKLLAMAAAKGGPVPNVAIGREEVRS